MPVVQEGSQEQADDGASGRVLCWGFTLHKGQGLMQGLPALVIDFVLLGFTLILYHVDLPIMELMSPQPIPLKPVEQSELAPNNTGRGSLAEIKRK